MTAPRDKQAPSDREAQVKAEVEALVKATTDEQIAVIQTVLGPKLKARHGPQQKGGHKG